MLAKFKTWPLRSRVFELCLSCSRSICILFRSRHAVGCFFFCLIFRATVHEHFPYSNETTTHVPSRLVTCAECRHTATPFVCPTIPRMKSNKCWSPWQPSYRSVLQFSLAPLSVPFFFFFFFWFRFPDPGKMFYKAVVAYTAVTSKFDVSCRPPPQRVFMVHTRHTYVPGTCIYAMNTYHTWHRVLGFSIYALEVFWIFCYRTPR